MRLSLTPSAEPLSGPKAYALAVGIVAAAVALRLALEPFLAGVQFITLFPAVILASYLCGARPGLLSAVLGGLATWYLLVPPRRSFRIEDPAYGYTLALFFAIAVVVAMLIGSIRQTRWSLATHEAQLRETDRQLNAVLDNASVAIFHMDERQQCSYMNAAAEALTGYTLAETKGRALHDVIHHTRPDGSHFPIEECAIDRAFPENNRVQGEEVFVHKDGHFYPVAFTASPIRAEAGAIVGTIIEVRDISEEKAAQEHQRLLINELNHRVKNTLAIVQSVAAQTFGSGDQAARQAFEGRLAALSGAHNILTEQKWESASLVEIAKRTASGCSGADPGRMTFEGPDLRMEPRTAVAVAMALHELCTNAMKYGALSVPGGKVAVRWRTDEGRLRLCWEESGGPPVREPERRGFGSRMIERGLAAELGGTAKIEFRREGVVCTVDAPLPQETPG